MITMRPYELHALEVLKDTSRENTISREILVDEMSVRVVMNEQYDHFKKRDYPKWVSRLRLSYLEKKNWVNTSGQFQEFCFISKTGISKLRKLLSKNQDNATRLNDLNGEKWASIFGHEDAYLVSNLGRVKSIKRTFTDKRGITQRIHEKILRVALTQDGYLHVRLSKDNKAVHKYVHRLVAEAFVPNPHNYPIVNHIDCNPSNPHFENLEWCTYSYNTLYSIKRKAEESKSHNIDLLKEVEV